MEQSPPPNQEVDFSHYTDNLPGNSSGAGQPVFHTEDNQLPRSRSYVKIVLIIGLVLVFTVALWFTLTHRRQAAQYIAPPGYRVVQPPNQPPRLEKIP